MEYATLSSILSIEMSTDSTRRHAERYVIAALILGAVIFILLRGPILQFNGMRLYFPDEKGQNLKLEMRHIAPIGSLEEKASDVIRELLLGPLTRNLQPLVHSDISLLRVVAGKNSIYLDFSTVSLEEISASYKLFKEAIEKSLHETIPGNYHVYIYINSILAR